MRFEERYKEIIKLAMDIAKDFIGSLITPRGHLDTNGLIERDKLQLDVFKKAIDDLLDIEELRSKNGKTKE